LDLIDFARVKHWINAIDDRRSPAEQMVWIVDNTFATPYCQRPL
jgi:cystathionine beta-lyase/cystathionine gamma-synthase